MSQDDTLILQSKSRLLRSSFYFAITVGIINVMVKSIAWFNTDSSAIFASLVDSCSDITTSTISLIAVRFALIPADDNHRFGHHKIQDLAVFGQSIFFFGSGIFTMIAAVYKWYIGVRIAAPDLGIKIMVFSTVLTLILVLYQQYVIYRTNSQIVAADKFHYFTDLLSNVIVIISIYTSGSYWFIDSLLGVVIALYIMYGASSLFRMSFANLVDEEMGEEDRRKILSVIRQYDEVHDVHDLKTRRAGDKAFIQFHLEMDADMTLYDAHELSDKIMEDLKQHFGDCEILVHQDPAGHDEEVSYRDTL